MPDTSSGSADEWQDHHLDLPAYLSRIGYDAELAPTGQTLAGLHRAHVAAIPFENADIMLGRGIAVDLAGIQDKLVRRGRGGYCFERRHPRGQPLHLDLPQRIVRACRCSHGRNGLQGTGDLGDTG